MAIRILKTACVFAVLLCDQAEAQTVFHRPEGGSAQTGDEKAVRVISEKVDEIFAEWNRNSSPGVALGVIRDGKVIYTRGYGMADLENNIPITSETAFYIGSTSKQFTAMCIALLEEEGKISIEDDIREYLPELPHNETPIRIRHLIHHLSGIRDYLTLWDLAGRDFADSYPEAEALAMIARQKALIFAPGEQYSYSNSNYFLLSLIVKRASGQSLREYANERIFQPLGMRNTYFHDDRSRMIRNRATGHFARDGGFAIYKSSFDLVGDGGLYTTVEDLLKWDQNFYDNRLGKGGSALIERMLTYGKVNDGREIIYTWGLQRQRYRGLPIVYHNGAFLGFRSELLRFPEQRFSVVVLANLNTIPAARLATRVADLYLSDLLQERPASAAQEQPQTPQRRDSVVLGDGQLQEYTGTFYSEELDVIYGLHVGDGQLMLKVGYRQSAALAVAGRDTFSVNGRLVSFVRDTQNRITSFGLSANPIKDIRFVKQ